MIKPTAVAYARYSSELQNATSIERQMELAEVYCSKNDLQLVRRFKDEAVSSYKGKNLDRELGRCIDYITKHGIEYLCIEHADRLSRDNPVVFLHWFTGLLKDGVKIIQTQSGVVLDPVRNTMQLFQLQFEQMAGHAENKKKAGRIKEACERRFKANRPASKLPYGYKRVSGAVVEHDTYGPVVRRIFEDFARHVSYNEIARRLNREGIPHPGLVHKRKHSQAKMYGTGWTAQAVKLLITNPVYATGGQRWELGTTVNAFPILIDASTHNNVAYIVSSFRHKTRRERAESGMSGNLFAGRMICKLCGGNFVITQSKSPSYRRYGCKQHTVDLCGNAFTIMVDSFEEQVLAELHDLIDVGPLADILEEIDTAHCKEMKRLQMKGASVEKKVTQEERRLRSLWDKYADIDKKFAKPLERELKERLAELERLKREAEKIDDAAKNAKAGKSEVIESLANDIDALKSMIKSGVRRIEHELLIDENVPSKKQLTQLTDKMEAKAIEVRKRGRLSLKMLLNELLDSIVIDARGEARINISNKKYFLVGLNDEPLKRPLSSSSS